MVLKKALFKLNLLKSFIVVHTEKHPYPKWSKKRKRKYMNDFKKIAEAIIYCVSEVKIKNYLRHYRELDLHFAEIESGRPIIESRKITNILE